MPAVEHTRSSDMTPVQFAAVDTTASVNTPIVAAHLLVCVWARVCVCGLCVCVLAGSLRVCEWAGTTFPLALPSLATPWWEDGPQLIQPHQPSSRQ